MPKRCFAVAAALAALPLGAAAQGDGDDAAPWSALPGDISEEPLPEPYFRDNLIGRYAAPGRCDTDSVDDLLVISAVGIQIGPVLCEGIGKMTWEDGRLLVPLSICRIDTRHQGERTLSLERLTGGDLSVRSDAEESFVPNEVMQRCGP
ncbi:MAG: hypothetical protein HLUCCA09_01610 [Rhodobacteraceae bacterium HLUCCA09]|nr:MAG: hypothetical protein HLUCCA09_01610 [Rhodobacteraceae bacterium HLUCCA09]